MNKQIQLKLWTQIAKNAPLMLAAVMASKRVKAELQKELSWLNERLTELIHQAEALDKRIQKAPTVETTLADGRRIRCSTADLRDLREYDDLMKLLGQFSHKKRQVQFWLSPPKGRPKGRGNQLPKAADPTMAAALGDWKNSPKPKPRARQLAYRYCKVKTEEGRKKWQHRFKKFKQKAKRS